MADLKLSVVAAGLAERHLNETPPIPEDAYFGVLGAELERGENKRPDIELTGDGFVRVHYSPQSGGTVGTTYGRSAQNHKPYQESEYIIPIASAFNVLRLDRFSKIIGGRINGVKLNSANIAGYMTSYEQQWMYWMGVIAQSDGTNRFGWLDSATPQATGTGGVVQFYNIASAKHFRGGDVVCFIAGGTTRADAQTGHDPGTPSVKKATATASDEGALIVQGVDYGNGTITLIRKDGSAITDLNAAVPTFAEGDHIGFIGAYPTDQEINDGITRSTVNGLGAYFCQFTAQAQGTRYNVSGAVDPNRFGQRVQISTSITADQMATKLREVVESIPRMTDVGVERDWDATLYFPTSFDQKVGAAFEGRSDVTISTDMAERVTQFRMGYTGTVATVGTHRIRFVPDPQMSDPWSRKDEDVVMRLVPDGLVGMPTQDGRPQWVSEGGEVLRSDTGLSEVQVAKFGADLQLVTGRFSGGITFAPDPDVAIP